MDDCLALWVPGNASREDATTPSLSDRLSGKPSDKLRETLRYLKQCFPNALWLAVEQLKGADDVRAFARIATLAAQTGLPCAATGHVLMHEKRRKRLQDVLTAIRLRRPLAALGQDAQPNAEQAMRPINTIADLYPPELLAETLTIADRCRFSLDELRYEYPQEIVPPGATPASHLRQLTYDGLVERYGRPSMATRMQQGSNAARHHRHQWRDGAGAGARFGDH